MNERANAPIPADAASSAAADARLDALAQPVADDGLSLALYATEPAEAVGVAHALALRLREAHGLEVEFFVPADGEGLVARLAQIVATVPPGVLHGQSPSLAPDRVLVAADATAIPVHAEQALAALVRDCPGANTRVILPVAGRPDLRDRRVAFGPRLVRLALDSAPVERDVDGEPVDRAPADVAASPPAPVGPSPESPPTVPWLAEPAEPARARRVGWLGGGLSAVVAAVVLGWLAFERADTPPAPVAGPVASMPVEPTSPAEAVGAAEAASAGRTDGADAPGRPAVPQDGQAPMAADAGPNAGGRADLAAGDAGPRAMAGGGPGGEGEAPPPAAPISRETKPVEAKPVEAKPVEAKPVEAKPVEAKPVEGPGGRAPARRPDADAVRRTRDRAWFVQHAAVASAEEAQAWLAERPELDRAGVVPILAADGREMLAIVTGPFTDRAGAQAWAEGRTRPDERWLRGARSLKAALRPS